MRATLPTLACLLSGLAAGWFSGVAPVDPPGETAADRLSPRQTRERQRAASRVVPADVAVRLAPIHAAETPQERLRAVIHLARTIPVAELARWYDSKWLKLQDRRDLAVFYEITRNRWLAEDPQGIMERARIQNWNNFTNGNNYNELANRWARTDPDGALAFVQTLGNVADQVRFLSATLRWLAESRPTEVLSLAKTHLDPIRNSYQWSEALRSLARHHPGLLESADLPPSLKDTARVMLIQARLEADFDTAFGRLISSPTGLADFKRIIRDSEAVRMLSERFTARYDDLPAEWLKSLSWNPAPSSGTRQIFQECRAEDGVRDGGPMGAG